MKTLRNLLRLLKTAQTAKANQPGQDPRAIAVSNANAGVAKVTPFVADYEKYRREAYLDTVANRWTMGYGQTYVDDPATGERRPVREGDTIEEPAARKAMQRTLADNASVIYQKLPWSRELTSDQLAPLYDVAYSGGVGLLTDKSPGLNREMSAPGVDRDAVLRKHLATYRKSNGKVVPGLVNRRRAGADRFLGPTPAAQTAQVAQAEKRGEAKGSALADLIRRFLKTGPAGRYLQMPRMVASRPLRETAASQFMKPLKVLTPSDYAAWVSTHIRNSEFGPRFLSRLPGATASDTSLRILGNEPYIRLLNQPGEMARILSRLESSTNPGTLSLDPLHLGRAGVAKVTALPVDRLSGSEMDLWRNYGIFPLSSMYGTLRLPDLPGATRKTPGRYVPFRLSTHHNGNTAVVRSAKEPGRWRRVPADTWGTDVMSATRAQGELGQKSFIDMHFPLSETASMYDQPEGLLPIRFSGLQGLSRDTPYFGGMKLTSGDFVAPGAQPY